MQHMALDIDQSSLEPCQLQDWADRNRKELGKDWQFHWAVNVDVLAMMAERRKGGPPKAARSKHLAPLVLHMKKGQDP